MAMGRLLQVFFPVARGVTDDFLPDRRSADQWQGGRFPVASAGDAFSKRPGDSGRRSR